MPLADFINAIVTKDKFSATFAKFDQAVSRSARGADTAARAVSGGGLMALTGGAAGVFAATQIGKTIWSMGELGAQSLTTKDSFASLMATIGQSPALLDRLSAAAGGTIGEMTLMQQTNTALAGTTGQLATEMAGALPKLLEAGRAAAKLNPAYGDAAFMFQSLVSGVKRGTPMLIDNTGIVLKLGDATEAYAKSVGKSVNELTSQERSIAILRATLAGADTLIAQAGGSSRSMAEEMAAADVAVKGLKTALGEMIAPATAEIATNVAYGIRSITAAINNDAMARLSVEIAYTVDALADMEAQTVRTEAGQRRHARAIEITRQRLGELVAEYQAINAPAQNAERLLLEYATEATNAGAASYNASYGVRQLRDSLDELRTARQAITPGLSGDIAKAIGGNTFTGSYGSAVTMLAGTPMEWDAVNRASLGFANSVAGLNTQLNSGKITLGQYNYEVARLRQGLSDTVSSYNSAGSAAGSYADKLKGLIGQQLSPTFDLSGLTGGLLGGMGGNSFDEAYKRLAAVALRPEEELAKHAGDWGDTFAQAGLTGLTPEEAAARAKELVEAYSKGLDFSLIDREAIKDSVRQAIKAEELYQTIVDEIYAEMGKPNPKAATAGHALGKQVGAGVLKAAREAGGVYAAELAMAVSPHVARILSQDAARYNL